MCGIVGLIEKKHNIYQSDFKLFEHLLLVDSLRGEDSTGAFTIYGKSGSVVYTKQATNPLNMFRTPEWKKFNSKAVQSGSILVGHNRKATVGEIKTANAHPFAEGNTILIHNGGITNWKKFDDKKVVDSHAVCSAIEREGHDAILPELEGAYTLVWYNVKDKQLHFARNEERPLVFMDTQNYQMFASERIFMEFACLKNGEKPGKSWDLATHTVATYDITERGWYNKKYTPKAKAWTGGSYSVGSYTPPLYTPPTSTLPPPTVPWVDTDEDELKEAIQKTFAPEQSQVCQIPGSRTPGKTDNVMIEKDMVVFFRVTEHKVDTSNGRIKIYGKCISPDMEHADVIHLMATSDLRVAEKTCKVGSIVQGKVLSVINPVCGLSVWVTDVKQPEEICDYTGFPWPANALRYLLLAYKNKCSYCENDRLILDDFKFSKVDYEVVNGINNWTIECPECVFSTLEGDERALFEKTYPHTLHNSQQIIKAAAV